MKFFVVLIVCCLALAPNSTAADVIISEFMASNTRTLADEDGDFSDWIELRNASTRPVNLESWRLTDDPAMLTKWTFPAVPLAPGGYLVVFASGKNRTNNLARLHTNFQMDNAGQFLALVKPDGATLASAFNPVYPPQLNDMSYGTEVRTTTTAFISTGAAARWLVPSAASGLPADWTATNFDHTAWSSGPTGLGYSDRVGTGLPPGNATNLARGKSATQSSTAHGMGPQLAVDGIMGNITHTAAGQNLPATWEVNLGTNYALESIVIYNRADCCQSRLRDLTVRILSADGASTNFSSALLNPENVLGGPPSLTLNLTNLPSGVVIGGRVRITRTPDPDLSGGTGNADEADVLSLAEVEVIGGPAEGLGGLIETDLSGSMCGINASALARIPFGIPVEEMPSLDLLLLRVKYNDGFVAYLNGTEIARRNAPDTLAWNSTASTARPISAALVFEDIDVSAFAGLLQEGENALAIHGLNAAAADSEFLILPELVGISVRVGSETYFNTPTPGAINSAGYLGFVADTKFSVNRGFYSAPFAVAITCATPEATIRYTTNGTAPSPVYGLLYSGPIPVNRSTVLRAIATKPGYKPSNVDTHTYVFLNKVVTQSLQTATNAGFPSSWPGGYPSADYAMDPRITGTNVAKMEAALRSLPSLFISTSVSNLFDANTGIYSHPTSGGIAWERPASLELVRTNGATEFQADCGLRVQGGYFRQASATHKHSLRVLFKEDYGQRKLHHDLFQEPDAVKEFDTFVLRAGANDGYAWNAAKDTEQFIRDNFGRYLQLATGHPAPHGRFVHLYLNGLYWGMYNLVERPNEDFSAAYFGGEPEEWDANNAGDIKNGDNQAWNTLLSLLKQPASPANYQKAQGNNPDSARNPAYPVYLDKLDYIDYMIINIWGGNWDWPWKNYWFGRLRTPGSTGFKFYTWDYENTMGNNRTRSPINMVSPAAGTESAGVGAPHYYLKNIAEYRMDFADRVHRFFFNGGLLCPPVLTNRYRALADSVEAAILCETARWGDDNLNPPQDLSDWLRERDWILGSYLPVRSDVVIQQFRNAGLYPAVAAPWFNQHGGDIPEGFALAMLHANTTGVIYFTLDGTDPRLVGGAVNSAAKPYTNTVVIRDNLRVKARVLSGSDWSALNEADFAVPGTLPLRITEIMFHPAPLAAAEIQAGFTNVEDFEYLELRNVGLRTINLAGARFTNGITFSFDSGTLLAGEHLLLVKNVAAFNFRFGQAANVVGPYQGNLNNGGERLSLVDALSRPILDFNYSDVWVPMADGFGFSLTIVDNAAPAATWNRASSWRASSSLGGSPGILDPPPTLFPYVVVNEVLSRPAVGGRVSVELANLGSTPASVGGWWLSDDFRTPKKFRLPASTVIPVGGFVVLTEDDINAPAQGTNAFSFSSGGGEARLFSADTGGELTGYCQGWDFGVAEQGVSFGRHVTSTGADHLVAQAAVTLGAANAGPRISPLVITELMYHPPDFGALDNSVDEFVEILNRTTANVDLFDPLTGTNAWQLRGGVDFFFPTNVSLAAGERMLLVNFDPVAAPSSLARFKALYGLSGGGKILGPYAGKLDNSGEDVELKRPTLLPTGLFAMVQLEKVSYHYSPPWPSGADGDGLSLQRCDVGAYGNDPGNWRAAAPLSGRLWDTDGDGIPDFWMSIYFGHQTGRVDDISLATQDADRDGMTNLQEYFAGTDPRDSTSVFKLGALGGSPGMSTNVVLFFQREAAKSYTIQWADTLLGPWSDLASFDSLSACGTIWFTNEIPIGNKQRFYRVLSPRRP